MRREAIGRTGLGELTAKLDSGQSYHVVFYGHPYYDERGQQQCASHVLTARGWEVAGTIEAAQQDGGIGVLQADGRYVFTPWPFAAIVVRPSPAGTTNTGTAGPGRVAHPGSD